MSDFYSNMAQVVLDKIGQFGQTLQLTRTIPGAVDPVTDAETGGGTESQPIKVLVLQASKGTIEAFDNRLAGDTLVMTKLRALKIAAAGLAWEPAAGQTVEFEGATWTLLGATPINPAGTPLLYNAAMQR